MSAKKGDPPIVNTWSNTLSVCFFLGEGPGVDIQINSWTITKKLHAWPGRQKIGGESIQGRVLWMNFEEQRRAINISVRNGDYIESHETWLFCDPQATEPKA